ncbi:MAG: methyltransferase domain-containing protein [Burkholderiaceae bacterium]|jgi:predicted nicotinamide N-methyase|nr:methyltransferase domain-containing protein [Burkholderiaceae bacterium]
MSGYRTTQQRIAIAGVEDLLIRSLHDRQQFHDPLGTAARLGISSATWSLFGQLWPSSLQLAARLAQRPVQHDERILEVGCGLALASLVGHRRGAHVTASDCHPLAEAFLRENLRLNGLGPLDYRHGHWNAPPARSHPDDEPMALPVQGGFGLIIASDVLYERDRDAGLARFIAAHSGEDGEVWIVDPDRRNRTAFNRQMAGLGFGANEERLHSPATIDSAAYKGRLTTYRRARGEAAD